ncbi:MAG: hypothetical protein ACTSVR_05450 [Candidatus Thorarchaeota archaeon]
MGESQFAINVSDLSQEQILAMIYSDVLANKVLVNTEPDRIDGIAVVIECEEERAKAIVETIRLKKNKNEMRIFESTDYMKTWRKIQ